MKLVEIKVYKYSELSETVKNKLIEAEQENQSEMFNDIYYSDLKDEYGETLSKMGFSDVEWNYSGFWSQGDGANFTADVDIEQFLKHENKLTENRALTRYLRSNICSCNIHRTGHRYSHENTVSISNEWDMTMNDDIEESMANYTRHILSVAKGIMRDFYRKLSEQYYSITERDNAIEELIYRESEGVFYYEDGDIYDL